MAVPSVSALSSIRPWHMLRPATVILFAAFRCAPQTATSSLELKTTIFRMLGYRRYVFTIKEHIFEPVPNSNSHCRFTLKFSPGKVFINSSLVSFGFPRRQYALGELHIRRIRTMIITRNCSILYP